MPEEVQEFIDYDDVFDIEDIPAISEAEWAMLLWEPGQELDDEILF